MKRIIAALFALLIFAFPLGAFAEQDAFEDDTQVYTMLDESGNVIMRHGGRIYPDDEYISADNQLYRVISVDDQSFTAVAKLIGVEPPDEESVQAFALADASSTSAPSETSGAEAKSDKKKLICMYSTHSDESYVPTDGTSSKTKDAGIYDVGDALKKNLEEKGIEVNYSKDTFLPHDAGAYRRSRSTAEDYVKMQPAAVIDIHRDGIPDASEYEKTVDGEKITQVRLLVGRSNPNSSANRSLAKQIKAEADKQYPGLIRDIFIGKGNYNQELYPQSILLEFGTHTSDKEDVIKSTAFMAEVLESTLFGGSAKAAAEQTTEDNKSGGSGIAWLIGIAVVGALVYALVATGSFKGMAAKLGRGASEITGGVIGKKPEDHDRGEE